MPGTHLQWTTMGPACAGLSVLTFFRNLSMPMGVKGTPKSGQLVKCSWQTSRGALQPSGSCCGERGDVSGRDGPAPLPTRRVTAPGPPLPSRREQPWGPVQRGAHQ